MATKPLNIILLGDPAAGKATQSALLIKRYKLYDFDMGQELRNRRRNDKALDQRLRENTDQGKLTPTGIVRRILRETIISTPQNRGILFDGHPKMLGEAKIAYQLLKKQRRQDPLVLYLSIPLDETVSRMQSREDYFKGKFSKRRDDTTEALKNRAKYYRKNIAQVVNFFDKHYRFEKISGLGTRQQVFRRIESAIKSFSEEP